jgi:hypothetical protein
MWRDVVSAMPADWWNASNAKLLVEYVRAGTMVDTLASRIRATDDFREFKDLMKLRDQESRRMVSYATKMRLSQQSTYTDKAGDTAKRNTATRKPWLTEG